MSSIFKDSDVVVENYCQLLDSIKKNEESYAEFKTMPYEKSLATKEEILLQAKLKAHKLIQNGVEYANEIILAANKKAQEEFIEAQKSGFEEGFHKGEKEAQTQIQSALGELSQLISRIEDKKEAILNGYENELKDLVMLIAKKVIHKELEKEDSLFLNIYQSAIKEHGKAEWVRLAVSKHEVDFAMTKADTLVGMTKGAKDIKVTVLEQAPRGTCIVETPTSVIDASVETQLNQLKETLSELNVMPRWASLLSDIA